MGNIRTYGMGGLAMSSPADFLASPPTTGGHLFWRLSIVGNDANNPSFAEIEMARTAGGADFASTAVSLDASNGPGTLGNTNDNDPATFWEVGVRASKEWVLFEFASATPLAELRVLPRTGIFANQTPTVFFVNGSDDKVNWNTYQICIADTWVSATEQTFAVGSTPYGTSKSDARVWLMNITNSNGAANVGVWEMIFAASVSGAQLATGGRPFTNNVEFSTDGFDAFDNSLSTNWASQAGSPPTGIVGYAWPTPPTVPIELRVATNDGTFNSEPRDWTVEWTADGITYTVAATVSSQTGWTPGAYRSYTLS